MKPLHEQSINFQDLYSKINENRFESYFSNALLHKLFDPIEFSSLFSFYHHINPTNLNHNEKIEYHKFLTDKHGKEIIDSAKKTSKKYDKFCAKIERIIKAIKDLLKKSSTEPIQRTSNIINVQTDKMLKEFNLSMFMDDIKKYCNIAATNELVKLADKKIFDKYNNNSDSYSAVEFEKEYEQVKSDLKSYFNVAISDNDFINKHKLDEIYTVKKYYDDYKTDGNITDKKLNTILKFARQIGLSFSDKRKIEEILNSEQTKDNPVPDYSTWIDCSCGGYEHCPKCQGFGKIPPTE